MFCIQIMFNVLCSICKTAKWIVASSSKKSSHYLKPSCINYKGLAGIYGNRDYAVLFIDCFIKASPGSFEVILYNLAFCYANDINCFFLKMPSFDTLGLCKELFSSNDFLPYLKVWRTTGIIVSFFLWCLWYLPVNIQNANSLRTRNQTCIWTL